MDDQPLGEQAPQCAARVVDIGASRQPTLELGRRLGPATEQRQQPPTCIEHGQGRGLAFALAVVVHRSRGGIQRDGNVGHRSVPLLGHMEQPLGEQLAGCCSGELELGDHRRGQVDEGLRDLDRQHGRGLLGISQASTPTTATWSATCAPMSGWGFRRSRCAPTAAPLAAMDTHEFLVLADTGESEVFYDSAVTDLTFGDREIDYDSVEQCQSGAGGVHLQIRPHRRDPRRGAVSTRSPRSAAGWRAASRSARSSISAPSIPTRWAPPCRAPTARTCRSTWAPTALASARLLGAIIEASHDDKGIIWPEGVTPVPLRHRQPQAGR